MGNIILHSTPLDEFKSIIGDIVEEKLRQFKPELPKPADGEYITRNQVCDKIKISLATLHAYTKCGILKGYRIGGRVLYRLSEIEQAVQAIQTTKYKHGKV